MHARYRVGLKTIGTNSRASRACLSQRARHPDFRIAPQWAISKVTSPRSSHGKWLSQSFRWMPVGSRRGPNRPSADIKWKHRDGLSFASADPPNICTDRYRKRAVCAAPKQLFFYFFHSLKIPYVVRNRARLTDLFVESKQNSNFQSLTRAFRSIISFF